MKSLKAQRSDADCNWCLLVYLPKQISFFLPARKGFLVAANYSFSVTYSAVNGLSNSAELVFIIPDVDKAAMCAFAAGDSAWWLL